MSCKEAHKFHGCMIPQKGEIDKWKIFMTIFRNRPAKKRIKITDEKKLKFLEDVTKNRCVEICPEQWRETFL